MRLLQFGILLRLLHRFSIVTIVLFESACLANMIFCANILFGGGMEIQEIDVALCTQRIRGLVERANGGVKEVATDSGVCQAAIYNYLKGRVPGLMQLFLLAQ